MEHAFDFLAKQAQVSIDLLEKIWISALIDSLLNKVLIGAAIFVAYRFVKALEMKWSNEREATAIRSEAAKLNAPFVRSDDSRYMPRG